MTFGPPLLDDAVRRLDGDRVLLGGSPRRLLTLSEKARGVLARGDWDLPSGRALARKLIDAGFAHPTPRGGPAPDQVSVVIPVRDREDALARLLAGLDPALEVIVVDDGSREPMPGAALRHPTAQGPAAARNAGIARATRPFIAVLDSDVVVPSGWLNALLPHFLDPRVGAVAPRIVAARGVCGEDSSAISRLLARYDAVRSPLDLGGRPARVEPGSRVSYLPAAALLLRRSALGEQRPFFDEDLRFGEDVDLVWRLVEAGWTVRYEPSSAVGHAHRTTLRAAAAQRFSYGSSAAPLQARHPAKLAPFAVNRWTLAAWSLLAIGHPRAAATSLAAATVRLSRALPVRRPLPLAAELVGGGTLAAGRALGEALWRPYAPLALTLSAAGGRRGRRIAAAALLVPAAVEYRRLRPDLDPLRWTILRTADDLAYGAGVWAGCLRHRSFAALRPRLS
ncbi:MAG TPA: mycofactocin biosynthesis glycosyltransferase MftF [Frankiaceae bacterium]|nr:mycofactocin biosynthesis glycosyltransferase MftF [Frankiaceae bacterium]